MINHPSPHPVTFNTTRLQPVNEPPLAEQRATANYNSNREVRKAIHALKYEGRVDLAESLGTRLIAEFHRSDWQPTLITAVPLAPIRLLERGYNQSALLADVLARSIGVPFHRETLRRVRYTRPQVGLKKTKRQENIANSFVAEPDLARNQRIVLIDDVCTTGATLKECAATLLKAGASIVWGLTVASVSLEPKAVDTISNRRAAIRIITDKRTHYRYAQLVMANGQTKSLGPLNPTTTTPLLDHVLMLAFRPGNGLDLPELEALMQANKSWRDLHVTWNDLDVWS